MRTTFFARLLLSFVALGAGLCMAAQRIPATVLADYAPAFEVTSSLSIWMEPARVASINDVSARIGEFTSTVPDMQHDLHDGNTLWVKLRIRRPVGATQAWTLNIPLPLIDSVTLYQPDGAGYWNTQSAGNSLPQALWNKHSLYPEFDITNLAGTDQEIYLQVRNFKKLNLPLRFAPSLQRDGQRLGEFAALGLILGCMLCLSLLSLIRYVEHRNRADMLASAYGLSITFTIAALNGIAGALFWSDTLFWSSYAHTALPPITMGLALLFLRDLYAISTRHRRYDMLLVSAGWAAIASTLSLAILDRAAAHIIITTVTLFGAVVGLIGSQLSWRFRSSIGRLLFASYVLQFLAVMRLIAESWGHVAVWWEFRYLTSLAIALSVPLLLYALSRATHDRKELAIRANHLPNQDALTGLLTRQAFMEQYAAAYARVLDDGEPVAVVLVSVVNHNHIRQVYGDTASEQCLLRAVIKLQRVLRDVDPAGRVDANRFALLLEGVADKDALNQRMVQLIASGLIPIPGLEPEVTLQFQVACVLLHHNPVTPERVMDELDGLLQDMSPRTRRPIRFLEAPPTHPVPPSLNPVAL
jgi:diguanylate cyclase (GGDEF)-like protein